MPSRNAKRGVVGGAPLPSGVQKQLAVKGARCLFVLVIVYCSLCMFVLFKVFVLRHWLLLKGARCSFREAARPKRAALRCLII